MHREIWRQSRRQSPRTLLRTQITKVGDVICVADFHALCPRLSPRGSFGKSCNVGVMEFGIKQTLFTFFIHAASACAFLRRADCMCWSWASCSAKRANNFWSSSCTNIHWLTVLTGNRRKISYTIQRSHYITTLPSDTNRAIMCYEL